MSNVYGCHNRAPFRPYYLPTGAPDTEQYRIPHVFTRECQYRHTALGKADPKCAGCEHKHQSPQEIAA